MRRAQGRIDERPLPHPDAKFARAARKTGGSGGNAARHPRRRGRRHCGRWRGHPADLYAERRVRHLSPDRRANVGRRADRFVGRRHPLLQRRFRPHDRPSARASRRNLDHGASYRRGCAIAGASVQRDGRRNPVDPAKGGRRGNNPRADFVDAHVCRRRAGALSGGHRPQTAGNARPGRKAERARPACGRRCA